MTNYAKIELSCVVSEADDYQPADHRFGLEEATSTPAFIVKGTGLAPTTAAVATIPLSPYTTIEAFLVKNTGDTTTMTVYYEATSGATEQIVAAEKMILLADLVVGTDITLNCAALTTPFEYMLLVKV